MTKLLTYFSGSNVEFPCIQIDEVLNFGMADVRNRNHRLDLTSHHLPHNSTPSNTCSNPYLVMLATDLGIMIFQITSSYPFGIDTTDILNIRLRPKPGGYGERFQGNRHEIASDRNIPHANDIFVRDLKHVKVPFSCTLNIPITLNK